MTNTRSSEGTADPYSRVPILLADCRAEQPNDGPTSAQEARRVPQHQPSGTAATIVGARDQGNFAMYGADEPASITHQLETILDCAREGTRPLADETFDVLFDGCAHLEQVVEALSTGGALPEADARLEAIS